jgi:Xaa-Pro aminopeptidase
MATRFLFLVTLLLSFYDLNAQPRDLLDEFPHSDFHQTRRAALRDLMPNNSVAVFFSNPIRNRANDVDYIYHQDPNMYYLTGYREPHGVLLIFKEPQKIYGKTVEEVLFVQERNEYEEMWDGKRLGVKGAENRLGFRMAMEGKQFEFFDLDFSWGQLCR